VIVTAKTITPEERAKLSVTVAGILEKAHFDTARFTAEVRRAMTGRRPGAVNG
jgi:hypothetical protein